MAGGSGGVLGGCPVFDTSSSDYLTLPDGNRHDWDDCPVGSALAAGQTLSWHSDGYWQGGGGGNGLPKSGNGRGGGWQVCFA